MNIIAKYMDGSVQNAVQVYTYKVRGTEWFYIQLARRYEEMSWVTLEFYAMRVVTPSLHQ